MNLDRHHSQYGRQAAIIGQEVQAARRDAEVACVYDESAARASTDASIDQAVLLQIKHVADDHQAAAIFNNKSHKHRLVPCWAL